MQGLIFFTLLFNTALLIILVMDKSFEETRKDAEEFFNKVVNPKKMDNMVRISYIDEEEELRKEEAEARKTEYEKDQDDLDFFRRLS